MAEKIISIKDGKMGKTPYYLYDIYDSWEEALYYAQKLKEERKMEYKVKYFILDIQEGALLPVPKVALYLNRKLRLL